MNRHRRTAVECLMHQRLGIGDAFWCVLHSYGPHVALHGFDADDGGAWGWMLDVDVSFDDLKGAPWVVSRRLAERVRPHVEQALAKALAETLE